MRIGNEILRKEKQLLTVAESLELMIAFGTFVLVLLGFVIVLIESNKK